MYTLSHLTHTDTHTHININIYIYIQCVCVCTCQTEEAFMIQATWSMRRALMADHTASTARDMPTITNLIGGGIVGGDCVCSF